MKDRYEYEVDIMITFKEPETETDAMDDELHLKKRKIVESIQNCLRMNKIPNNVHFETEYLENASEDIYC